MNFSCHTCIKINIHYETEIHDSSIAVLQVFSWEFSAARSRPGLKFTTQSLSRQNSIQGRRPRKSLAGQIKLHSQLHATGHYNVMTGSPSNRHQEQRASASRQSSLNLTGQVRTASGQSSSKQVLTQALTHSRKPANNGNRRV